MTIATNHSLAQYIAQLRSGKLIWGTPPAPNDACRARADAAPLVLSDSRVQRTAFTISGVGDEAVILKTEIELALARCSACKGRWRVLPCDLIERKLYSLPVIESMLRDNSKGKSLRVVAYSMLGDRTPSYSTLHSFEEHKRLKHKRLGAVAEWVA